MYYALGSEDDPACLSGLGSVVKKAAPRRIVRRVAPRPVKARSGSVGEENPFDENCPTAGYAVGKKDCFWVGPGFDCANVGYEGPAGSAGVSGAREGDEFCYKKGKRVVSFNQDTRCVTCANEGQEKKPGKAPKDKPAKPARGPKAEPEARGCKASESIWPDTQNCVPKKCHRLMQRDQKTGFCIFPKPASEKERQEQLAFQLARLKPMLQGFVTLLKNHMRSDPDDASGAPKPAFTGDFNTDTTSGVSDRFKNQLFSAFASYSDVRIDMEVLMPELFMPFVSVFTKTDLATSILILKALENHLQNINETGRPGGNRFTTGEQDVGNYALIVEDYVVLYRIVKNLISVYFDVRAALPEKLQVAYRLETIPPVVPVAQAQFFQAKLGALWTPWNAKYPMIEVVQVEVAARMRGMSGNGSGLGVLAAVVVGLYLLSR